MKLYAQEPNRKNGEAWAQVGDVIYKFTGADLACDVPDKEHAELLRAYGFMTIEDVEAESALVKQLAAREERKAKPAAKSAKPRRGRRSKAEVSGLDATGSLD